MYSLSRSCQYCERKLTSISWIEAPADARTPQTWDLLPTTAPHFRVCMLGGVLRIQSKNALDDGVWRSRTLKTNGGLFRSFAIDDAETLSKQKSEAKERLLSNGNAQMRPMASSTPWTIIIDNCNVSTSAQLVKVVSKISGGHRVQSSPYKDKDLTMVSCAVTLGKVCKAEVTGSRLGMLSAPNIKSSKSMARCRTTSATLFEGYFTNS